MAETVDALGKLQALLKELFQIEDAAELDFGIYRVMGQKREEVEGFIYERLPKVVNDALESGSLARSAEASAKRKEIAEKITENFGDQAISDSGKLADAFHETPLGSQYLSLPAGNASDEPKELRAAIFNHLYTFFSRYYDNGDFISRRRYSKRERYAVPYNGEEVHLHWANADQYYIKSGNHFLDYSFDAGDIKVRFVLASADTEQNDVKETDRRFVPKTADAEYDIETKTVAVPFEWRPLSAKEKSEYGTQKQQNKINAAAEASLLKRFEGNVEVSAALSKIEAGKSVSVLARHLGRYARKNSSDFFVHKDLEAFLTRELDFYIKNEVLDVDALLAANGAGADLLAARFETVRAMRGIALAVISFLAQIEDFQKRVFEKKKFVVESHYCMTLDRVPEEFYEEITKNEAQYADWEDMYAIDEIENTLENGGDRHTAGWLHANKHLVLDTKHFTREFEDGLLSRVEDLDDSTDGLLINADNFQALGLIGNRYAGQVKCIYIDPPYNTGGDGFIYKDRYQHSTWLTMMENRLRLAKPIMGSDSFLFVSIDDREFSNLSALFRLRHPVENLLPTITWEKRTKAQNTKTARRMLQAKTEYVVGYRKESGQQRFFLETGKPNEYPHSDESGSYRLQEIGQMSAEGTRGRQTMIYPILGIKPRQGMQWKLGKGEVSSLETDNRLVLKDENVFQIIRPEHEEANRHVPFWSHFFDKDTYGTAETGSSEVRDDLGFGREMETVKPTKLIQKIIYHTTSKDGETILDFFAGSGTTGHAVIDLNREDGGSRKYILVEQGKYFDSVLKRRIQKVVYSKGWKDGRPTERETGVSHAFKYMTLESYEDALDNIHFDGDSGALDLYGAGDEYLIKYMLGFESRTSETFMNAARLESPFDYRLKVRRPDRDDAQAGESVVDLPETFAYLLGMNVKTRKVIYDGERRYLIYRGATAERESVVVIWRTVRDWQKEDYERDRDFVAQNDLTEGADDVFVNGDSLIEGARSLEPTFRKFMFPDGLLEGA